uniref:RNA methyltransferase n=1 Tax=Caenorhabditis tropicalis TaxID=1561998 RepID=A0A1I7UUM8_9PELO
MSGHRRGSFRGRKRFYKDNFAPGGSKTDPLNINIELTDNPEEEKKKLGLLDPEPERHDRPKRRKIDKEEKKPDKRSDTPQESPPKKIQNGSPKKDNRRNHLSKEEKDANEFRKNKNEYFNRKYRYGNFDRYYGIRLNPGERDLRLSAFDKVWFEHKSVLDIGCNVGFVTLSIAKEFSPRRILGIDIDEHLIGVARKNIRHYCDHETAVAGKFPASFGTQFGTISQKTEEPRSFSTKFPDNIWFKKENYVLENDEMLDMIQPEFDVILALSITKWIHLNWGDDGMRRFFKRAYAQLHPGGRFIIEPQLFESYRKRAKMNEELKANYSKIEFKPEDFEMWLIETVGFESVEKLGVAGAKSKGFERPIDVYLKPVRPKTDAIPLGYI